MEKTINNAILAHKEGRLKDAEYLYREILKNEPKHVDANHNLGLLLISLNKSAEAIPLLKIAVETNPSIEQFWVSYTTALINEKQFEEAEKISKKAIILKPKFVAAHYILGVILSKLQRLSEAIACYKKVIELKPDFAEVYSNLGDALHELDKSDEAIVAFQKAIELNPVYVENYNSLGNILLKFNKLEEAEKCYKKAIELNPNYVQAHSNLGVTQHQLDKFEEAKASYKKAIELNPDFTDAHSNLSVMLRQNELLKKILQEKKSNQKNKLSETSSSIRLKSNPFISSRAVEEELVTCLNKMSSKKLNNTKGVFFGKGRHSENFQLFKTSSENNSSIIKTVEEDLINIMKQAVKSNIFIIDSFFNLLVAGGGSFPHSHVNNFDKTKGLINQKYSLQYYLSVGDQNCSEPGIFKLQDPDDEILPSNGMIMIIPASRIHSAVYNGKKDRLMIGVNFYSLL